ncbi:Acid ceramidase N-terminal domain-containing protein [Pleurotus pulmonarius]
MPPVGRSRSAHSKTSETSADTPSPRKRSKDGRSKSFEPPTFTIDLSLPPRERHREICRTFRKELQTLVPLYDEIMSYMPFPRLFRAAAKMALRRVASREETEEMLGIVEETGIPRYLVVAYNTFLDIMSGCVSGGVRVCDAGLDGRTEGVVHFRGLDWEMEQLRALTICIEYVRGGEVVARSVSYAGYTGVLTGVRQGLSMSLNYRMRILSPSSQFSHRIHQLALLFGLRPSVSSYLREILLSPGKAPRPRSIIAAVPKLYSSPSYLVFCTPSTALLLEKDLQGATVYVGDGVSGGERLGSQEGEYLIVATNHDCHMESWSKAQWKEAIDSHSEIVEGLSKNILEDSIERKQTVVDMWQRKIKRTLGRRSTSPALDLLQVRDVQKWLQRKPVLNECTHFSCIMDPSVDGGGLLWVRSYSEPVDMNKP